MEGDSAPNLRELPFDAGDHFVNSRKILDILKYMEQHGHEQLVVCSEPSVGLRAFIAIHDTTLGPALGGVRMWPYENEEDAILDVLRLSRAMTYKSAAADLALGGGKALIVADPQKDKTEALFRAFARHVDTLGGRYITTTDVWHLYPRSGIHFPWRPNTWLAFRLRSAAAAIPLSSRAWEFTWG